MPAYERMGKAAARKEKGLIDVNLNAGNVVVKVRPVTLRPARQGRGVKRLKTRRTQKEARALNAATHRFPIQLYAVVDYFAGSIDAATPLAEVELLREERGPAWSGTFALFCQVLCWWISALRLCAFFSKQVCWSQGSCSHWCSSWSGGQRPGRGVLSIGEHLNERACANASWLFVQVVRHLLAQNGNVLRLHAFAGPGSGLSP